MNVVSSITGRNWDLILGINKTPNEEDQYTAVMVLYPPNSIKKMLREESVRKIGIYIVETGSWDEIVKYREVGAFSEWPISRFSYSVNQDPEMSERDIEFGKWMEKTLKEYVPMPEKEAGPRKKKWWKRLLGMRLGRVLNGVETVS